MKKYVEWPELPDAVSVFYGIAAELSEMSQCYYVIFSMGTIIKVPIGETKTDNHFTGYTPEHMETWPMWKINATEEEPFTATEIYNDLVQVWTRQSSECDCIIHEDNECDISSDSSDINHTRCIRRIVKCAYKILNDNQLHDILPIVCEVEQNTTYMVEFCNGLNLVFTNGHNDIETSQKKSENLVEPVDIAISLREYDLMFPQIYAIITPTLELIVFAD